MTRRMLRWTTAAGLVAAGLLLTAPPPSAGPAAAAPGQGNPQRPHQADPVEQLERKRRQQEEAVKREEERLGRAARADRREALRQVQEDLVKLQKTLDAFEATLAKTDPDQQLSLELRRQSEGLEKLAKRIRKNTKRL